MSSLLEAQLARLDVQAERLLDAARGQLVEFGLRRTSMEDIARAAKLGRATLFRRFPSRATLEQALAAREALGAIARVDAKIAGIEDPEEFLVASAVAAVHEATRNELLQRLLVTDPEQMLPLLTGRGAPIIAIGREYIAGQLRRLQAGGATLTGDPAVLGEMLARLVLSLALTPEGVLPVSDDERFAALARDTFVPMIIKAKE